MIKFRVNTQNGYTEFLEKNAECLAFHSQYGVGEIEEMPIEQPQWNREKFILLLSAAFDIRFEIEWREKGYTDINDLISHSVNTESIYHQEALSLLRWSHSSWEIAVNGLDENSNIETIINSLPVYE